MRNTAMLLLVLAACMTGDQQTADTAGGGAPAMLTAADVSGAWNGTTLAEGGDSVLNRWTTNVTSDTTAIMVFEGRPDTVRTTVRFDADSMVAESEPYTSAAVPGAGLVRFRSVGRLQDGRLVGTTTVMPEARPDSVVLRARWEATRGTP